MTGSTAVAVAFVVSDKGVGEVGGLVDADAEARAEEEAIDDDGVTVELAGDESQSPKRDRHPSPQKSGPEPQYSY